MLRLFKKTGRNSAQPNNANAFENKVGDDDREQLPNGHKPPLRGFEEEEEEEEEKTSGIRVRSRLAKSLDDALRDKAALEHFALFLEARNAHFFLQCLRDIDCFQLSLANVNLTSKNVSFTCKNVDLTNENVNLISKNVSLTDLTSENVDMSNKNVDSRIQYAFSANNGMSLLNDSVCSENANKNEPETSSLSSNSSFSNSSDSIGVSCSNGARFSKTAETPESENERGAKFKNFKTNLKNEFAQNNNNNAQSLQDVTNNALDIFKSYIALEALQNISCPEVIRNELIEDICDEKKIKSGICFLKIREYIYDVLKCHFDNFYSSDFYVKYQIEYLTSKNINLKDILNNETALFYFMEFLENENQRILLDFYVSATNFQLQLKLATEQDLNEAQNDAIILYDKYFSLQALNPLGFSDKIRFELEQNICGENGLIKLKCFENALKIVERFFEFKYFAPFLQSQLFYKFLSDLINSLSVNGNNESNSCASSENGSFLALDLSNKNDKVQKKQKCQSTDMNIDTSALNDPDSLWKNKKKFYRLSCGRISELGRFKSDFEPDPDKNKSNKSKVKNIVKKFVSFDDSEDQEKEDMAWQVAEMIVKDITSVTLNCS